MAKISMTVCDVDGNPNVGAATYRVSIDGKTYSVDLCDEHSAPIKELVKLAEAKGTVRTGGKGPGRGRTESFASKVKTIEEIEAEKAAASKPAKKAAAKPR